MIKGLADIADGTALCSVGHIFFFEGGTLADEECAGSDILGVVGEPGDQGVLYFRKLSLYEQMLFPEAPGVGFKCILFHVRSFRLQD